MTHARLMRGGWLLIAALLLMPALALAGGWSVTTLDETPTGIESGKPFTVGFTVRAHGKTPLDDLSPTLSFSNAEGERIKATATHDGKPGHYVATVTLPSAGTWDWLIDSYGEPARMSPLTVAAPSPAQPEARVAVAAQNLPALALAGIAIAALAAIGAVAAIRGRRRVGAEA